MYKRILVGVDGSTPSNYAAQLALSMAEKCQGCELVGSHVYAARMHRARFEEMEPNLPSHYQTEEKLGYLRGVHDGIISGGMKLISTSYLKDLEEEANKRRLHYRTETPEGRNYVEINKMAKAFGADLMVVGATGLGNVPETSIGSLCERILLGQVDRDVLVVRRQWSSRGPIVIGVDGSKEGFQAMSRGLEIAAAFNAPVRAVAVYDPYFHGGVFNSISGVLTEEGKQKFNFAAQEQLHDEIIDRGLEAIYNSGLKKAAEMAKERGMDLTTEVLMGKVFSQIHHYADVVGARLVVMGRWGLHREEGSLIGSNSMNLARITNTNLLVTGGAVPADDSVSNRGPTTMSIEREVSGGDVPSPPANVGDAPSAELVVLRKTKMFAPEFHRHIVKSRIEDQIVHKGEKVLVYEVESTVPEGEVRVTSYTRLEFK
jgi:nucleotide-binding universal stress UspA family protein